MQANTTTFSLSGRHSRLAFAVAATIDIDCWSFYPAPALPSAASVAGAARPFL
jgi:hypothetical protein